MFSEQTRNKNEIVSQTQMKHLKHHNTIQLKVTVPSPAMKKADCASQS